MSTRYVNVKGLAELKQAMLDLPAKIEAKILRGALRAGAQVFAEEARRRVPEDSGALRDSIRVGTSVRRGVVKTTIKAGSRATKKRVSKKQDGGVSVEYANPWYAHFVEYGTAPHYIKASTAKALILRGNKRASSGFAKRWTSWVIEGVKHPGARAKPFMRPAFDSAHLAAVSAVRDYIAARLPREIARHGGGGGA